MSLIDQLERRVGWLAIDGLPIYVVTAQSILYLWALVNPASRSWFALDPVSVWYGHEYWRLLTFLFVIPIQNAIFAFFFLYLLYIYGTALETIWGSFHFSLFYYTGALGTALAGLFFGGSDGAFYLNISIFFAFAALNPDFVLYFFFVIPMKVKWLALFSWVLIFIELWRQPLGGKIAILISLLNYVLFFGKTHVLWVVDRFRNAQHKQRFKEWNK